MVRVSGREVASDEDLRSFYRERIRSFGFSSQGMFYHDTEQHKRKLLAVSKATSAVLNSYPCVRAVLDIGCGYGELLRYLPACPSYLGIDLVPEFVSEAEVWYPKLGFITKNIFDGDAPEGDLSILAGVLSSVPDPAKLLARVLSLSKYASIFDVTIEGRLPHHFLDLNRFRGQVVEEIVSRASFVVDYTADEGASWVLFVVRRIS